MTGLTLQLAQFAVNPGFDAGSGEAFTVAKTGIADTTATMFAGCTEPVVGILLKHYAHLTGGSGSTAAPVPFKKILLPSAQAACVNGTAAHALDYDDVALAGHPSTVITPAILAEGHVLGCSGADLLRAYIVGYEVWAELYSRDRFSMVAVALKSPTSSAAAPFKVTSPVAIERTPSFSDDSST